MNNIIRAIIDVKSMPQDWVGLFLGFSGPLIGVVAGALFTSRITEKQLRDNNCFIIMTNNKEKIIDYFDDVHTLTNSMIGLLSEINMNIEIFRGAYTDKDFEKYNEYLNNIVLINNSLSEKLNHLGSIYNLMRKYFGEQDTEIINFNNDIIINTKNLIEYFNDVHNELMRIYNEFRMNHVYLSFIVDSRDLINHVKMSDQVTNLMSQNVGKIDDYLNNKIVKLIK